MATPLEMSCLSKILLPNVLLVMNEHITIGNVAAITMSNDIAKARKEDKLLEVSAYLKEKHVARSLKKKVEEFFKKTQFS